MNTIFRLVWSQAEQRMVVASEVARGRGKSGGKATSTPTLIAHTAASILIAACAIPAGAVAINALPTGGQISAGAAAISSTANTLTVNQSSQRAAINWQSFSVGSNATVNFVQPNASSVILNRVVGTEQSVIAGAMNANGQVFLLNSNGVLFTGTSSVNVGALVASTLNVSDADFMAGRNTFTASSNKASVINLGTITAADGGYVALLGNQVKNEGVITARLGTAILAAGDQISLNFNGDSLVGVTIDQGTLNALVENKQAIHADGGLVVLTAKGLDAVMATVVNNTGEIRAQTVANREGKIYLLGGMENDRIEVGGTLDASAPNGGNGGFVETSAADVRMMDGRRVTTQAANGRTGMWLIDPNDYTIAASGGNITGTQLGTDLASNNGVIATASQGTAGGNGDIFVNDAVSWSSNNSLTLTAERNININQNITASGATAKLVLNYGQGAAASGNTATYSIATGKKVNLQAGQNFDTKLGSDGALTNWTVVNALGASGDRTSAPGIMTLQGMAATSSLTGMYALGADIDASATSGWDSGAGFYPIGWSPAFSGKFDGLGHTITGLTINRPTMNDVGLFGYANGTTSFSNVGLVGGSITGGTNRVGALVGSMSSGTVTSSYSSANVSGVGKVGGLVGNIASSVTMTSSYSTGSVTGTGSYIGGLVGYANNIKLYSSYATGAVSGGGDVGGLVGYIAYSGDTRIIQNRELR